MKREPNPAQRAELERLIADQEADDTGVIRSWERSLDAPLTDDGEASLYELRELEPLESVPVGSRSKHSYKIRPEQVREWRALRDKEHWTYAQIAKYAGVRDITVRRHISCANGQRADERLWRLEQRLEEAQRAYEAGAFLREIAELLYEEAGYSSWQSCYQQLRVLFQRHGVAIRPKRISRRGRPEKGASLEAWQRFWRAHNGRMKQNRQAKLTRCDGLVGERPCRRFAVLGSRYCVSHNPVTKRKAVWSKETIIAALRKWASGNGRNPRTHDWARAGDDHPSVGTVVNHFGRWNVALSEAGLLKLDKAREERRTKIARGYKECAANGCENLVSPLRRYCRDRDCQVDRLYDGTCIIPKCERKELSRGWCMTHYQRWRRHGDPQAGVPIEERAA